MNTDAAEVDQFLAELAEDRREALGAVRQAILANLPDGIVEVLHGKMITYEVPLATYPDTYNKQPLQLAALASQKNHMAIYLTMVYGDEAEKEWFVAEYTATGKKLDMGKSCVRFKKLDQLPVELIGEVMGRASLDGFIKMYENRAS